jgi:putative MATE family efflux protein
MGMGLAVAGSVTVAQATGAGDEQEARYAASQTVSLSLIAAALLGAVGYFVVTPLLDVFGASPDVLPRAASYMRVISLGLVFMFGFFVFISLMRGYGDTITPMLVMFGSVAINVVLDPFLIFGWWVFPELGVRGAAFATVFSRSLALVVGLWIMFSGRRGLEINLADMAPDLEYIRKLLRIGVPASIEGTGRALSVNLMLIVVGAFPTTVVAAFGVGIRVFSVIFMPAIAVARGVETMTGQNLGAGKPDRAATAARFAAIVTFGALSALGVVAWVADGAIVGAFTDDPAVVEVGATFLRYVAPTFGMLGIMRAYNGSFRGAGRTLTAAAIGITTLGIVRLPLAWVLSTTALAETGIWLSFAISNVVGATLAWGWYQRGTWRDGDVTRGPEPGVDESLDPEPDPTDPTATDD